MTSFVFHTAFLVALSNFVFVSDIVSDVGKYSSVVELPLDDTHLRLEKSLVTKIGAPLCGTKCSLTLKIKNETSTDLRIVSVTPSCGCIVVDFPKEQDFKKGSDCQLELDINVPKSPGAFSQNVKLRFDGLGSSAVDMPVHVVFTASSPVKFQTEPIEVDAKKGLLQDSFQLKTVSPDIVLIPSQCGFAGRLIQVGSTSLMNDGLQMSIKLASDDSATPEVALIDTEELQVSYRLVNEANDVSHSFSSPVAIQHRGVVSVTPKRILLSQSNGIWKGRFLVFAPDARAARLENPIRIATEDGIEVQLKAKELGPKGYVCEAILSATGSTKEYPDELKSRLFVETDDSPSDAEHTRRSETLIFVFHKQ